MKTLLFCTSYAENPQRWEARYRKWLDFFSSSKVQRDQILLIDDGSPCLPAWRGTRVLRELPSQVPSEKSVIFHFEKNLGRPALLIYPGWFRSFCFAATYARRYGFDKIVHVESDCFLYTARVVRYLNELRSGWTSMWCESQGFPETCIQVICADQMDKYLELSTMDYDRQLANRLIEVLLPFTNVCKDFIGDRYSEFGEWVPEDADFGCQIPESWPV